MKHCPTYYEIANAIIDRIIERANIRGFATQRELKVYAQMITKLFGDGAY